ncbi:hypothetical protein [Vagococcus intermedius]|uniref:Uncharacterized protein n=1 Tax=Vagococcus intermedius TaxID=2991418 RepID=A0AAF0CWQ5_9ENTE|nr:hypothetical protein [Vagococcus intermedius]WEG74226.1 hypothetical protein OL234_04840 [Vagococcus intermedius]WEG76308.1 hypothetical protein OL235_04845 [Vagococcus intermedius]
MSEGNNEAKQQRNFLITPKKTLKHPMSEMDIISWIENYGENNHREIEIITSQHPITFTMEEIKYRADIVFIKEKATLKCSEIPNR